MLKQVYDHNCKLCPLSSTVPRHEWVCVEGNGDFGSRGIILGEAPGKNESEKGVPFIGRAGDILDKALQKAGLERKDIFVTNTVKCRPPDNRKPEQFEEDACRVYLRREFAIVNPIAVLALGNHALRASTGLWGISKYIGIWQSVPRKNLDNLLVLPTWHPAYILRQPTHLEEFELCVQDFLHKLRTALPYSE